MRARTGARRRGREGGSWRPPSPPTPTRQVRRRRRVRTCLLTDRPALRSGGDASALTRTGQYVSELFQSGAVTCLICIASVRRTQAVSAARHQLALTGFADDSLNAAPPPQCSSSSPVPPPAGVELQRLLLPLPPALHPEVGPGLGLPRVLRDRRRLRSEGAPVAVVRPRPLLVLFSFRVGYFLNVGGNLDGEHQAVGFWFRGEPDQNLLGFCGGSGLSPF